MKPVSVCHCHTYQNANSNSLLSSNVQSVFTFPLSSQVTCEIILQELGSIEDLLAIFSESLKPLLTPPPKLVIC